MVSDKMLEKFKKIYFDKYHVSLSNKEAIEMAEPLLNLMKFLVKPSSTKTNAAKNTIKGGTNEDQPIRK